MYRVRVCFRNLLICQGCQCHVRLPCQRGDKTLPFCAQSLYDTAGVGLQNIREGVGWHLPFFREENTRL